MRKKLVLEQLENRQMLSASPVQYFFNDGRLDIYGSSSADEISAQMQCNTETTAATVKVTIGHGRNAAVKTFDDVTRLTINGNDGNDRIWLSGNNMFNFHSWVTIAGGNGNDIVRIMNYDGSVYVYGNNGNDRIDASRSFGKFTLTEGVTYRWLFGGSGNDRIMGSSGNDDLRGDEGNDIINAGAGDDWLDGGSGNNILKGGAGNDTFQVIPLNGLFPAAAYYGMLGGIDKIFGGVGNDTVYKVWNSEMVSFGFYYRDNSIENTIVIDVAGGG